MLPGEWFSTMLSEFTASALLVAAGFLVGRYRERRRLRGKDLHQYDFYPYVPTAEKFAEFSLKDFRLGVHSLLRNPDARAARSSSASRTRYASSSGRRTYAPARHMGIEVLVHDLSNPSRSITCIEGGEVTGRSLEMGTTTLLVDLIRRVNMSEDKLNYELNIGARRFKCTTIPIVRQG